MLQPLDVTVVYPLKATFAQNLTLLHSKFTKSNDPALTNIEPDAVKLRRRLFRGFVDASESALSSANCIAGFRAAENRPIDSERLLNNCFTPRSICQPLSQELLLQGTSSLSSRELTSGDSLQFLGENKEILFTTE
jgi:hypothetical protein